jgi:hypothetical protein
MAPRAAARELRSCLSTMPLHTLEHRIRTDYTDMPGLSPTLRQAQRLWHLDAHTCSTLLTRLADAGFLRRTSNGRFVRCSPGLKAHRWRTHERFG